MRTVNIHAAKTQLSRLVDEAAAGDSFIIAKAGKPLVTVTGLGKPAAAGVRRFGFLKGQFRFPKDFDRMAEDEIATLAGLAR